MSRILVAYYSRTGTTQKVAKKIAKALSADIEVIEDCNDRFGFSGYLWSAFDARFQRLTALKNIVHPPSDYDLVIVGSPVWSASMSSPILTYIRQHYEEFKSIALFCTCGAHGERAIAQMERECAKRPIAELILRDRNVVDGSMTSELDRFIEAIRDHFLHERESRPMSGEGSRDRGALHLYS